MCPHKRAFVLDHGIIGDKNGEVYISCKQFLSLSPQRHSCFFILGPLHKRNFSLTSGECHNDTSYSIIAFSVMISDDRVYLLLPPPEIISSVLSTEKWMVRKGDADEFGRNKAGLIELKSEDGRVSNGIGGNDNGVVNGGGCEGMCGDAKLEW